MCSKTSGYNNKGENGRTLDSFFGLKSEGNNVMKRPCVLSCFVTSAVVVSLNRRVYYSFCQELLFYYLLSDGYSDIRYFSLIFELFLSSENFASKVSVPSEVLFVFLSLLFRLIYILTPI